ncbi:MAG: class I SAM-dependent methyltransferase [Bacteroidales bacterium]|nr:class I SAM-dependent methyltransferase [Bacteroidales bacterium]MCF8387371.1 class I SAM-dependent methyltransferase [Bacteroidales bacterium]MCF8397849.1 class I SAM-dependent methyltransferase [Bacteroidales bacterium]
MKYDPIKRSLGNIFNKTPFLRKVFYCMLDLLLLRTWHVKRELKRFGKANKHEIQVLDAGSGFGQYDYFMARKFKNWKIRAVDVKEEQIADCKRFFERIGKKKVHFEYADLVQFDEQDKYDLILSVDVMEHIEEDVKVFENFNRALKKDGMLLVSTPSDQGGSDVHDHDHDVTYNNDGTRSFIDEHVRDGYNIEEIQEKLKSAGFRKTEALYQYGKPGMISWRISMKYPILMLNASKLFFIMLPFYYLLMFPLSLILNKIDVNTRHETGTGLIIKAWK